MVFKQKILARMGNPQETDMSGITYSDTSDIVELWHTKLGDGRTPFQEKSYLVKIPGICAKIHLL